MSRLHLVRHGPTHAKAMVGWSDLPADLSDTAALARLSGHLPEKAMVVSSDLSRAVATADAIQGVRPRLPHRAGLREMHFGAWELCSSAEISARDPERARAFWENPGEVRPPGGESWDQARARIDATIDALIADHPGRELIVVAHFGVILMQIQRARRVPAEEVLCQRIDNLSVSTISIHGSDWRVEAVNHLP